MKTKLLFSLAIVFMSLVTKAQCVNTQTANITITNTMVLPASSSGVVLICSTGKLYDTLMNSSVFKYYLEPGAKLITKNGSTLFINMKANSSYTNYGFSPFNKMVYAEPGATMVSTFTVPIIPTTCSVVSFPASPLCSPNGISEKSNANNLVSFYPNPAKNNLTILNESFETFNLVIVNSLGQKVKSFTLEDGKKTIDVSDLSEGIYYISVSDNSKSIYFKKIIIVK